MLHELKTLLKHKNRKIVIVSHIKPDGDAIGSSMALYNFLIKQDHEVTVIMPSDYPKNIAWVKNTDKIIVFSENTLQLASEKVEHADLIICVDFSRLSRIDKLGELIRESSAYKVMIDHHLDPEKFAHFEIHDTTAASASSLVFKLIKDLDYSLMDIDIANCLYMGLMTDTGCFRHNNVTSLEFEIGAELAKFGINANKIYRNVYETSSLDRMKLIGYSLTKMQYIEKYNTVYIALSLSELSELNAKTGDTEGLVNYGLEIEGVKMSVLMYEKQKGDIKMSFRSNDDVAVNLIAKHFSGGGHKNASGGSSNLSIDETVQKLINVLPLHKDMLQ